MSAKSKKKRNKSYRGNEAAIRPVVMKVTAANRNKVSQYWFEKKRVIKIVAIVILVIIVIAWLIFELFRVASGAR